MRHPYSVSFYTLGCRLNQAETAMLCQTFRDAGYTIKESGEQSDICVINTCAVTGQSEAKCRTLIRRILRKFPDTFMIVVGCYPQVGADMLKTIPGVDMIVGAGQKFRLFDYLSRLSEHRDGLLHFAKRAEPLFILSESDNHDGFTMSSSGDFGEQIRVNLKIQDGCDFFCAYCIVPHARGRHCSRDFADIRRAAWQLAQRGYREIVVTGVNIGMYAYQGKTLLDVLRMLEEIDGIRRIRLTSIEPMAIPNGVIAYMASSPKLCHFMHIPLQSGDNEILRRMNRRYTRETFAEFVTNLHDAVPDVNIGADMIVGFPGEGDAEFEHSRELLEQLPINYAHVFMFSPRPGTPAAAFKDRVHPAVMQQRSQILRRLSAEKRRKYYSSHIGQTVSVLFEQREEDGLFTGYTGNYIKVGVSTEADLANCFGDVTLTSVHGKIVRGELINIIQRKDASRAEVVARNDDILAPTGS